MKRLLTGRTQIGLVGRSTAALAARRWGVAVVVRGGIIRGRLINRRWHGNLRHCRRLGRQRRHNWDGGSFDRYEAGKVRFEYRIDRHVRSHGQRGSNRRCGRRRDYCGREAFRPREPRNARRSARRDWGRPAAVRLPPRDPRKAPARSAHRRDDRAADQAALWRAQVPARPTTSRRASSRPRPSARRALASPAATTCGRSIRRSVLASPVRSCIRRSARYLPGDPLSRAHATEPRVARALPRHAWSRARAFIGDFTRSRWPNCGGRTINVTAGCRKLAVVRRWAGLPWTGSRWSDRLS